MTTVAASLAAPAVPRRPGYDPDPASTARRVLPMLADERVVWLSTVHPDGRPHLVPTWFWWDGEALLVWSKPEAVKVRNLRADPRLMVAIGDPGADFAVGLIEATADLVDAVVPGAFFAKYAAGLAAAGLDPAAYRAEYPQAIRITPTRFLSWHGRGEGHGRSPFGVAVEPRTARPGLADRVAGWLAARLRGASERLEGASSGLRPYAPGPAGA